LKYLYAYIHLNPVRHRNFGVPADAADREMRERDAAMDFLNSFRYSSYLDLAGKSDGRDEGAILTPEQFPEYFTTPHDFDALMKEWAELGAMFGRAKP
jgi:hypothetical protein